MDCLADPEKWPGFKAIVAPYSLNISSKEISMDKFADVMQESPAGGLRANKGKLRFDLIPPEMDKAVAEVLTQGATKYGDRNWEK